MSDAPLFQDTDRQEELYSGKQPASEEAVIVPGAVLGGAAVGSPVVGAGTPGILPPVIAPESPDAVDDKTATGEDRSEPRS